jgi:hypothetical protein
MIFFKPASQLETKNGEHVSSKHWNSLHSQVTKSTAKSFNIYRRRKISSNYSRSSKQFERMKYVKVTS